MNVFLQFKIPQRYIKNRNNERETTYKPEVVMRMRYFLLVIFVMSCMTNARMSKTPPRRPSYVYLTNNGQIDLMIYGVLIPAQPIDTHTYPVPVTDNWLIISLPNQDPKELAQKIKLLDADIGNTIKIGGYYNTQEGRYLVSVLRSNKIPIILALKKNIKSLFLPRRL